MIVATNTPLDRQAVRNVGARAVATCVSSVPYDRPWPLLEAAAAGRRSGAGPRLSGEGASPGEGAAGVEGGPQRRRWKRRGAGEAPSPVR